jgi:hypothetical protein
MEIRFVFVRVRTHPLGDAPGVRGAPALGAHFEGHLVLLQLHVPVHARRHLQRRARHGAAVLHRTQQQIHQARKTRTNHHLMPRRVYVVAAAVPGSRTRRAWR